jgi:hypothetical protein
MKKYVDPRNPVVTILINKNHEMFPSFHMFRYVTCENDIKEETQRLVEAQEMSLPYLQNLL